MRVFIGSTFLIATLAGHFVAQAGAFVDVNPGQSTGSGLPAADNDSPIDAVSDLEYVDTAVENRDLQVVASVSTARAIATPLPFSWAGQWATESPSKPSLIAGGVLRLSAVLAGIHQRRPSVLRL